MQVGVLAALSLLALGVFVDSHLFRKRGQPVAGITWDGSWWERLIVALFWPALVGGMLIVGLPAYCYMRTKAVAQIRGPAGHRRSPLLGLLIGLAGVVVGVGLTVTMISGAARLLPSDSFATDTSTDHEATDWARAHGPNVEVTCDRRVDSSRRGLVRLLRIGDDDQDVVRITGIVADAAGRTDWRFTS